MVDHSSSLRCFVQQSTDMDIEQANVLLCFDVVREIIDQQELPSDQEDAKARIKAELGNVSDFYKWLNKALAPQFEGTATTTNCKYIFENGEALFAPHPNHYRYDYTLSPPAQMGLWHLVDVRPAAWCQNENKKTRKTRRKNFLNS